MKRYLLSYMVMVVLIGTVYSTLFLLTASGQQNNNENKGANMQNKNANKKIDVEIDKIITKVKKLANEYNKMTKKQLLKDKGLISSEEKGNSQIVQIFDKNKKAKKKFVFTNDFIKSVSYRNDKEDGFDIFYYANGVLGSFVEYKNGKLHGPFVKFYKDGKLQYIANCQDGKFIGHAKRWDKSGKLVESVEFQQPQDFKIDKIPPQTTDD